MRRIMLLLGLVPAVVAVLVVSMPSAATAQGESAGRVYGDHVAVCAQTVGFDGVHNPGMHRGLSGWGGGSC